MITATDALKEIHERRTNSILTNICNGFISKEVIPCMAVSEDNRCVLRIRDRPKVTVEQLVSELRMRGFVVLHDPNEYGLVSITIPTVL